MKTPTTNLSTTVQPADRTGQLLKTTGYYAAFIALGLANASLGPTLPGLAEQTQARLSEISYLFTARSLGYLLAALLGGRLYDRLPGHTLMATTLLVMAMMLALAPLVPALWLLTAVMLLLGIAESGLDVGGNTLLVWLHQDKVGPFMNGMHFFFGVGAFLSPIIIAQALLVSGGITWAYWFLALLMLPAAIWLLRQSSPPFPAISPDEPVRPVRGALVALIALFFFLYVGAEVSYGGWIFTYTVTRGLSNEAAAAYLTSAFWGALTAGRLLSIPLAARLRPRAILGLDLAGCLASVAVIVLWPQSLAVVWLGTLGLGLSMASIFPTTLSLAERHMPISGRVTGWFFAGASVGGMTLPWLIGQLFETIGPQVTMLAIMVALVAAVAVFIALMLYVSTRSTTVGQIG